LQKISSPESIADESRRFGHPSILSKSGPGIPTQEGHS
jgi:hypothetical protein